MSRAWEGTVRVHPNDRTADVHTETHTSKLLAIRQCFTCVRNVAGPRASKQRQAHRRPSRAAGRHGWICGTVDRASSSRSFRKVSPSTESEV